MSDSQCAVIYDLHSYVATSDGRLTPQELAHRAREMRVGALAITDRDSVATIPAVREEIARAGLPLTLVNDVEISTLWKNHEIHIVGLNIDIAHPAMTALLEKRKARRQLRDQTVAERLEKARIPDVWEGALRLANGDAVTRDYFARFLMEAGHAKNMAEVFKKYLTRGKAGYVPPQWCTIRQAIDVIYHSGDKAVIAHPGRYDLSTGWLERLLAHLGEQGGDTMEVAQCQQAPHERAQLATLVMQFGLLTSQGSDFHQPCAWIKLGRKLQLPVGMEGIWHDREAAAEQKLRGRYEPVFLYPSG